MEPQVDLSFHFIVCKHDASFESYYTSVHRCNLSYSFILRPVLIFLLLITYKYQYFKR